MCECQTLIDADIIITQNRERKILKNSSIAISGGYILAMGPTEEMHARWRGDLNFKLGLVMPGMINAHTHAAMTFLRGMADDLPLMEWLEKTVFPVEAHLSREIVLLGSLLGYAEMLATGTTGCMDMYIHEEAVFAAAEKAGIRCVGGEAVFAFPSAAFSNYRQALESTAELAAKYSDNDRIDVAVNPHSIYTTTPEILASCRNLALELDVPLHIHLAETKAETEKCLQEYSLRPVEWCAHHGLLDTQLVAAHLVDISEAEIALLAMAGACGVHNPSSNMKLASGAAPVGKMLAGGLSMGLGTDGPASNNTLNMFQEMSRAALLGKLANSDPAELSAQKVLDMATIGGAKVLGHPELGVLEAGRPADLIALDLNSPNMQPLYNPVSQAVYAASGHECCFTMVGGEVLFVNGHYTRFDYEDLLNEIEILRNFSLRHCGKI